MGAAKGDVVLQGGKRYQKGVVMLITIIVKITAIVVMVAAVVYFVYL
jgi:hypothetical protein